MKILKTLCFATSLVLLASCGGNSSESSKDEKNDDATEMIEGAEENTLLKLATSSEDGTETKSSEEKTEESKSSDTPNLDEWLDKYEGIVDEYIEISKKINDGDLTVLSDLANLQKKAADLADDINKYKDELTSEQASRLADIAKKLADAVAEAAKAAQ